MNDEDVRELEKGKRVAEELLYLVLEKIGEPVELTSERLRGGIVGDKMIDLTLDNQRDVWTIKIVEVPNE
jgi:hypothetical protein